MRSNHASNDDDSDEPSSHGDLQAAGSRSKPLNVIKCPSAHRGTQRLLEGRFPMSMHNAPLFILTDY